MRGAGVLLSLALSVVCSYGCSASPWLPFSDQANEFCIDMPSPVSTTTKTSGFAQYEARDGEVSYTVSVNKRSTLSEKEEIEVFAGTLASTFESGLKKAGYPAVRSIEKDVTGTNWRGKLYQFDKADGSKTSIQVCVEPKHNIILYAFGGALDDLKTKNFFDSFKVR